MDVYHGGVVVCMRVMFMQESEAAVASYAASAKRHRPIKTEYNEYIGMLQG